MSSNVFTDMRFPWIRCGSDKCFRFNLNATGFNSFFFIFCSFAAGIGCFWKTIINAVFNYGISKILTHCRGKSAKPFLQIINNRKSKLNDKFEYDKCVDTVHKKFRKNKLQFMGHYLCFSFALNGSENCSFPLAINCDLESRIHANH